jgi:hypothetical protein
VRGTSQFRAVNANAPGPGGERPDPSLGTVTQIQSTAQTSLDRLTASLDMRVPQGVQGARVTTAANPQPSTMSSPAAGRTRIG